MYVILPCSIQLLVELPIEFLEPACETFMLATSVQSKGFLKQLFTRAIIFSRRIESSYCKNGEVRLYFNKICQIPQHGLYQTHTTDLNLNKRGHSPLHHTNNSNLDHVTNSCKPIHTKIFLLMAICEFPLPVKT